MKSENTAGARTYGGLLMVTLATLMQEILLTRIFSVTMWYHFVFLAISVAMFGLTLGGLLVYLGPQYFTGQHAKGRIARAGWMFAGVTIVLIALYVWYHLFSPAFMVAVFGLAVGGLVWGDLAPQFLRSEEVEKHLSAAALGFAATTVVSLLVYLRLPPVFNLTVLGILNMVTILGVISVPFIFSGIAVCLALTKFPQRVAQLYAADLIGAAAGCILIVYILRFIDAPTAVILSAVMAGVGALLFALGDPTSWLCRRSMWCTGLIAVICVLNAVLASKQMPMLGVAWMNAESADRPIYEKWNSFSRVVVEGDPNATYEPFFWGVSPTYRVHAMVKQLSVRIDAGAQTVMTRYDGDFRNLDYLKYDITNVAHYFRPDSQVMVIGAGGGRDILAALAFGQKSVTAIEMNKAILQALNQRFGDFTGHLDADPRVRFVNDEARSYIARMPEHVDIIQASLVDTWAATSSGAFALAENGIYTSEAWRLFLDHLTRRGLLSFTRWYDPQYPAETYRLVSLATDALTQTGVEDPRSHIIVVKCAAWPGLFVGPVGVATILVGKQPFSSGDLDLLQTLAERMEFEIMLSPRQAANPIFAGLASEKERSGLVKTLPGRLASPTDDCPFFLCNFGVHDVFRSLLRRHSQGERNPGSEEVLGAIFMGVAVLTVLCLLVPWVFVGQKAGVARNAPLFFYFAAIGLGFMLVEVSQLQRLMIFLGHPAYSLSTVLFTLLLSSGLGSYSTGFSHHAASKLWATARLLALLVTLALFGLLTPYASAAFASASTPVRLMVAAGILFPIGFLMGMAFPLGMKAASARSDTLTPWLWGLNGAASVLASVVAFLIVLGSGISTAFWTGFGCYAVAFASYLWIVRRKNLPSS